ncbi:TetR/AcrR family transcriptional regulator [Nocardia sp. NPDC059091]|uniref:TetR/AcrR family transcriptional regulator n=1 Tax=unclassified Nocardia TaxID=2637762 RepID=UPI00369F991D
MSPRRSDARERMLTSAIALIRRAGASGTSLDEILAHSGAPRGSLYHHFPGGRDQLIQEAVDIAGGGINRILGDAGERSLVEVFDSFAGAWRESLISGEFRSGCPILAAAIESADRTPGVVDAAGRAFTAWRTALESVLRDHGAAPATARRLSNLAVAAIEGAVVLSRVDGSIDPVDDVIHSLRPLFIDVTEPDQPGPR